MSDALELLRSLRDPWPPEAHDLVRRARDLPGWARSTGAVRDLLAAQQRVHGDVGARRRRFVGRRPGMVFHAVVTGGLRSSSPYVESALEAFEATEAATSLRTMAGGVPDTHRMKEAKLRLASDVAAGLARFAEVHRLADEDEAVARWARHVAPYELRIDEEPYVGHLPFVDEVLVGYLRQCSGGDAARPDRRLWGMLRTFGFPLGGDWLTDADRRDTIVLATAIAAELDVDRTEIDELALHV